MGKRLERVEACVQCARDDKDDRLHHYLLHLRDRNHHLLLLPHLRHNHDHFSLLRF